MIPSARLCRYLLRKGIAGGDIPAVRLAD